MSRSVGMKQLLAVGTLTIILWYSASSQWSGASHDTLTRDSFRDEVGRQALSVDESGVQHAVWQRANPGSGWRIFYSRKAPSGQWTPADEVGDSTIQSFTPALAVQPTTRVPHVLYRASYAGNDEIVCARESPGVWIRTRLTNNTTQDVSPTIAFDASGNVHGAWIGQDTSLNWKIMYATNIGGVWRTQLLMGSELGPFGSGAEPFIAVTSAGVAHIFYRGGDFGTYRIHHAWNTQPAGTTWSYEIISTPNGNDFTARAVVDAQGTIHLLVSGNDGFGFPPQVYYLTKPPGGTWSAPEHTNAGRSAWGGSLVVDRFGRAHITLDEVSGNIYTGNLYYATNRTGTWSNTSILADGKTYNGSLAIDGTGKGHAIAYNGESFQTQEILVIHSASAVTGLTNDQGTLPFGVILYHNYPNPFNPTTYLRYSVPHRTHVKLQVVDVLGKVSATLVDATQEAGTYTVTFDASNVATGAYFARLSTGEALRTIRMIVSR